MNRKQRRIALKQQKPLAASPPPAAGSAADRLLAEARWHQHHGNFGEAAKAFKRLLAVAPERAEAWNNFGVVLRAQGKMDEAAAAFRQSLALYPQLLDDFGSIVNLLISLNPTLGASMKRAEAAWPLTAGAFGFIWAARDRRDCRRSIAALGFAIHHGAQLRARVAAHIAAPIPVAGCGSAKQ